MICDRYLNMTSIERIEFIGKLNHAVQSDIFLMIMADKIIAKGEAMGLFEGVTILPERTDIDNELNQQ